ncbi:hypothetical protein C8F01DRAFT_1122990 [Mycena amicta]|nr:hypothetical protein C8F01DRAFT_1122990 [Mycena amicta]
MSEANCSNPPNMQRGGACTNCRWRCDGARPTCAQCTNRPPRSGEQCRFEVESAPGRQTPSQMQGTPKSLTTRLKDLERSTPSPALEDIPASCRTRFNCPFTQLETRNCRLNTFIERFAHSGYFFLDPKRFTQSALLRLPLGHPSRPSPSLLSIVYLWGSLLLSSMPRSFSEDTFLLATLQHLPADIRGFAIHPKLVVETIQAEVLLSVYYLNAALPIQGRYHAAAAASLAMSVGLHVLHTSKYQPYPVFPLAEMILPLANDPIEQMERVNAFWGVVIVNNYWVAAQGCPSAIPHGTTVDTPWPSGTIVGSTISRFLNGQETDGFTSFALLAKASTLLERVCSVRSPLDSSAFTALDTRLPTDRALRLTHTLVDLAILRLHAPLARSSGQSRYQLLASAARIASGLSEAQASTGNDPLYAPICSSVCSVYADELATLRAGASTPQARAQYQEIEQRFNLVMSVMNRLAKSSPIMQQCLASVAGGTGRS